MKILSNCRKSDKMVSFKSKFIGTMAAMIFGIILGTISVWLKSYEDTGTWFSHFINVINLSEVMNRRTFYIIIGVMICIDTNSPFRAVLNILFFYVGCLTGIYGYEFLILSSKIVLEYKELLITAGSLLLSSFFIWYAKGEGWFSILMSSIVIAFFFSQAFNYGMWYIDIAYYFEFGVYIWSIIILFKNFNKTFLTILYSLSFSVFFNLILPYIGLGK